MQSNDSIGGALRRVCEANGVSIAEWARIRGFAPALVYRVLRGETKALRGQTHEIAVALGIKRAPSAEEVGMLHAAFRNRSEEQKPGGMNM